MKRNVATLHVSRYKNRTPKEIDARRSANGNSSIRTAAKELCQCAICSKTLTHAEEVPPISGQTEWVAPFAIVCEDSAIELAYDKIPNTKNPAKRRASERCMSVMRKVYTFTLFIPVGL